MRQEIVGIIHTRYSHPAVICAQQTYCASVTAAGSVVHGDKGGGDRVENHGQRFLQRAIKDTAYRLIVGLNDNIWSKALNNTAEIEAVQHTDGIPRQQGAATCGRDCHLGRQGACGND